MARRPAGLFRRPAVPVFLTVLSLVAGAGVASAQSRSKTLQIRSVQTPPAIDGRLDDACWQGVEPAAGFVQYDPANGVPASEQTLVWAAYDDRHVYFAFLLKDSRPDRIWAELTPRNRYSLNDSITVILDTYNDQRTSIQFTVNPKGVQSNSVETIWTSEAIVRQDGWSAEIAVPFKSLRFSAADAPVWGINFERYINRLNERDYWTAVERDKPLLTQMGELRGLASIRPGSNLELFPYGGARMSRWAGETDDKMAGGLDVKYGIRSNLVLDVTASPDFSEVESDPFLYQLSPYENYLGERRPFFTEGSSYFRTAIEHGDGFGGPSLSLFYSRRVQNPDFAAKLTGKAGGYSFGMLGAANDNPDTGREPIAAMRLQKDVLGDSQVGLFFTSLESGGQRNRNVAADYSFRYRGIYSLNGLHAVTFNDDRPDGQSAVHMVRLDRQPDAGLTAGLSFDRVEKNVSIATGFVSRTDAQSSKANLGYGWRLGHGRVKHVSLGISGDVVQDTGGTLRGQTVGLSGSMTLRPQVEVMAMAETGRSRHQVYTAADSETLMWTDRFIDGREVWAGLFWSRGGLLKNIHLNAGWEKRGIYDDTYTVAEPGRQLETEASFTFRPRSNIEVEVGSGYTRQVLDATGEEAFSGATYEARLHHQITRRFFVSGNVQGETRDHQYSLDFVMGYEFGAGNLFQLAYKKGSTLDEDVRERGYSLTAKVSYLLRL